MTDVGRLLDLGLCLLLTAYLEAFSICNACSASMSVCAKAHLGVRTNLPINMMKLSLQ